MAILKQGEIRGERVVKCMTQNDLTWVKRSVQTFFRVFPYAEHISGNPATGENEQ